MEMTADRPGESKSGRPIKPGDVVTYICHVIGGMVKVRFADGFEDVVHPHCFKQLR